MDKEFDEIRPYEDEELPRVYEELLADEAFCTVVQAVMPGVTMEAVGTRMRACRTKEEFQRVFCYPLLQRIMREATGGVTLDRSAVVDKSLPCTYVSNHRDIVLDSGLLSVLLVADGSNTVEIAIGDNLLIYPWIRKLVRINKSFIVQRALTMRQMLEASARMSRYMHYVIGEKKQSLWIAQREGRAKDSNDRTQESVLKMMAMGGEGSLKERLMQLHIVPLAISYEYDPCDYLKALEFQLKRDVPGYKKSQADDLLHMQTGIFGWKGRVRFKTAACIDAEIGQMDDSLPKQEFFARVAALIDRGIHSNYCFFPVNYVAADLLEGGTRFNGYYTLEERRAFEEYLSGQLDRIQIERKDVTFLREKLLQMYANPLRNALALRETGAGV